MKQYAIVIAALALLLSSCQKEISITESDNTRMGAPESFVVSTPMTRSMLSGHSVYWSTGDKIRVYGHNTETDSYSDNAVYELTEGSGDETATFTIVEGEELSGTYDAYYAVYPSTLTMTGLPDNMILPRLNVSPSHLRDQKPSAGQYDPNLAVMTAVFDRDRLVFRHGVGYVKITIPLDNVSKVDINFTNNCMADTPTYSAASGSISTVSNSSKNITATGSFVKGQSYYLAAIPREGYSIGTTTVTYTVENDDDHSVSTDHFKGKSIVVGKIFDLGSPSVVEGPKITFTQPAKVAYDAEGGSFGYSIANAPEGAVATAEVTSGTWVTGVSVSGNTVSFTCEKNDAADAVERTATIKLSYTGAEDVLVTITQKVNVPKESYRWDFAGFTDEQMKEITGLEADTKATAGQTWDFGDGLTMVTNSSSKWNVGTINGAAYKWVATGGKYGSNQKFFSFTTQSVGTVTVLYASGKDNTPRSLSISAGGSVTTDEENVSSGTKDLKTVTFSSVPAGTILLYSTVDNILVFSIDLLED